jgi:hypothetical protein
MFRFSMLKVSLLGIAALSFTAVGCGGDDDDDDGREAAGGGSGTAAPFETGVSGEKPFADLSSDEAKRICTSYSSYVSTRVTPDLMKKYECNIQAALAVQSDAECATKVDECLQQATGEPVDGLEELTGNCEAETTSPSQSSCAVTVGEFQACAVAMIDQLVTFFDAVTCAGVRAAAQSGGESPITEAPALPEACQKIEQKCPGLVNNPSADE